MIYPMEDINIFKLLKTKKDNNHENFNNFIRRTGKFFCHQC